MTALTTGPKLTKILDGNYRWTGGHYGDVAILRVGRGCWKAFGNGVTLTKGGTLREVLATLITVEMAGR